MVSWITYSGVTRDQARSTWWAKAGISIIAGTLAGSTTGAMLGAVGSLVDVETRSLGVLCLAWFGLVVSLAEWTSGARLLPQRDRETPQQLLDHGPIRWALENGILLGVGFGSRLGTWLWFVVPVCCLSSGSPAAGALIYGGYGLARLGTSGALAAFSVSQTAVDVPACVLSWRRPALSVGNSIFRITCVAVLAALI